MTCKPANLTFGEKFYQIFVVDKNSFSYVQVAVSGHLRCLLGYEEQYSYLLASCFAADEFRMRKIYVKFYFRKNVFLLSLPRLNPAAPQCKKGWLPIIFSVEIFK